MGHIIALYDENIHHKSFATSSHFMTNVFVTKNLLRHLPHHLPPHPIYDERIRHKMFATSSATSPATSPVTSIHHIISHVARSDGILSDVFSLEQ